MQRPILPIATLILAALGTGAIIAWFSERARYDLPPIPVEQPANQVGGAGDAGAVPAYGVPVAVRPGVSVAYPDGLRLTPGAFQDSRCRPGQTCIWQGEISLVVALAGGALREPGEVRLGTVTASEADAAPYHFALAHADESVAILLVTLAADDVMAGDDGPSADDGMPADVDAAPPAAKECRRSGCSGEVCADDDVITACIYKAEYACYTDAVCERQSDGHCGFTVSPVVAACLQNAPTMFAPEDSPQ